MKIREVGERRIIVSWLDHNTGEELSQLVDSTNYKQLPNRNLIRIAECRLMQLETPPSERVTPADRLFYAGAWLEERSLRISHAAKELGIPRKEKAIRIRRTEDFEWLLFGLSERYREEMISHVDELASDLREARVSEPKIRRFIAWEFIKLTTTHFGVFTLKLGNLIVLAEKLWKIFDELIKK